MKQKIKTFDLDSYMWDTKNHNKTLYRIFLCENQVCWDINKEYIMLYDKTGAFIDQEDYRKSWFKYYYVGKKVLFILRTDETGKLFFPSF